MRRSSSASCRSISSNASSHHTDVAEQCGRYVLHELLTTEQQYVEDLANGIHRYTRIFQPEAELPEGLVGQQHVLLANVAQIAALHRHKLLPLMLQHRQDLELLFERWLELIERGCFNCYVLFTASQRDSNRIFDSHELYFKRLEITLGDPLGCRSFLLKPVQRITKYPLMLQELMKKLFDNRQVISKSLFETTCRLETRLRELLVRANQSDQLNDIRHFNAFSILSEVSFISVGEFPLHDARLRCSYNCKLFAFNTCLIYTEAKGRKQLVRGTFKLPDVCFVAKSKSFVLCNKQRECEFLCHNPAMVQKWETIVLQLLGNKFDNKLDELVEANDEEEPGGDAGAGAGEEGAGAGAGAGEVAAGEDVAAILDKQQSRTTWYTTL
ncbi:triple functional domain protein-like [Drosophila innubila]|uniref:triple functional domain protein-like n=1 Tax=Drosophila innubila TaxID=198719 RepID=UPI00148CF90F|nr:triple functional domain protein-like [Drosophila innubila]